MAYISRYEALDRAKQCFTDAHKSEMLGRAIRDALAGNDHAQYLIYETECGYAWTGIDDITAYEYNSKTDIIVQNKPHVYD